MAFLGGEPGSGKSRLVREFAQHAARGGALVLYGACDAVIQTPYGPFAQAFEHLIRVLDQDELRTALGARGEELTRLLPDLGVGHGPLASPMWADPDTERHRLHVAVAELLAGVGRERAIVVVIEDAQWADAPTLLLLRHLARTASGPLLLMATFREEQVDMPETLARMLADLRRADDVVRLRLAGLSQDEVAEFIQRAGDRRWSGDPSALARALSELTGGNPFLMCELWRSLLDNKVLEVAGGVMRLTSPLASLGTPASVREVVSDRLSRLALSTGVLLDFAATVGPEFGLDIVRHGAGLAEADLLAALDESVRSGIVEELSERSLVYRFTHELVRRAVYDRLTGVRRSELHLRVGNALEAAGERSGRTLAELAYHFAAAAPLGDVGRAITYNVGAARAAVDALAFDQAAELLCAALALGVDEPELRAEVLIELGDARQRAGRSRDALEALRSAASMARELGKPELLARAAIGYEAAGWALFDERDATELLEEATASLGDQRPDLRVGLLTGLARVLDLRGDHTRAMIVRANAIDLARELEDRSGLAKVLMLSYWSRGADSNQKILAMLTEAKQLGEELGSAEIQVEAMATRVPTFMSIGDLASARREMPAMRDAAEAAQQPLFIYMVEQFGSAIALADGRLEDAEAMAWRSYEAGQLLTGRDASGTYGIQMFSLRREQGRLAELMPAIRILATGKREHGPWRPGLVSLLAEVGMETEARRELAQIIEVGVERTTMPLWLASLTYITDACTTLGDRAGAEFVYPQLEPFAGTTVMIGQGVACYGSVDRYLGMLAATLGEWERAEQSFEYAMGLNREMGASTWLAHTEYEYARMLLARGDPEPQRVAALLDEASRLAETIGLKTLHGRIKAMAAPVTAASLPDELSRREAQVIRLVAYGLTNREIGVSLFISEHTVARHVSNILTKTGCANRTEAASYAHRHALVDVS